MFILWTIWCKTSHKPECHGSINMGWIRDGSALDSICLQYVMIHFYTLCSLIKKRLTHQGKFLVTGFHRQIPIEWLRITKYYQVMTMDDPCKHHKVYACLFSRQPDKSLLTKLDSVGLKNYQSVYWNILLVTCRNPFPYTVTRNRPEWLVVQTPTNKKYCFEPKYH